MTQHSQYFMASDAQISEFNQSFGLTDSEMDKL